LINFCVELLKTMPGIPVAKIIMEATGAVHYLVVKDEDKERYTVCPNKECRSGYPQLVIRYTDPTILVTGEWKICHGEDQVYSIEVDKTGAPWKLQACSSDPFVSFGFSELRKKSEGVFQARGCYINETFTRIQGEDGYVYHSGLSLTGKPMWDYIIVKPGLSQAVIYILMMLVACGDLVNMNFCKESELEEKEVREVKLATLQAKKELHTDTERFVEQVFKELASQQVTRVSDFVGPQVLLSPDVFDKLEPIYQSLCGNFPSEKAGKEESQKSGGLKLALKHKLQSAKTLLKMSVGAQKRFFTMMVVCKNDLHKKKDSFREKLYKGKRFFQVEVPENLCDLTRADLDCAKELVSAAEDLLDILRMTVRIGHDMLMENDYASDRAELTPEEISKYKEALSSLLSFVPNSEEEHKHLLYLTRDWIDAAKNGEIDSHTYGSGFENPEVTRMKKAKEYVKIRRYGKRWDEKRAEDKSSDEDADDAD